MIDWNIHNHRGLGVIGYPFPATLSIPPGPPKITIVGEIRDWIQNDHIDAIESRQDYTWYFKHESDRTMLLLTWIE